MELEKDIILVSYIAENYMYKLINARYLELSKQFNVKYLDKFSLSAYENFKLINSEEFMQSIKNVASCDDIFLIKDSSILSFLYNYAKKNNKGLKIKQKNISIRQMSIEICEFYSLNPYRLPSDFICIFCDNAFRLIERLKELNILASHIGFLTKEKEKLIIDKENIQFINDEKEDEIYKIL